MEQYSLLCLLAKRPLAGLHFRFGNEVVSVTPEIEFCYLTSLQPFNLIKTRMVPVSFYSV